MRQCLSWMVLLGALFFAPVQASAQRDLRAKLEAAYQAYFTAIEAGDADEFKRSLAPFRYAKMRNRAISIHEKFPQSFFEAVKLNGLLIELVRLQHIKTVALGDVAYMMYFNRVIEDPLNEYAKPVAVITSFLFVKDSGRWKFAEAEQTNFRGEKAKVTPSKLAEEAAPIFRESEGALSGRVPAVPSEYAILEYSGSLVVRAANCKVTVKYNSETEVFEDSSRTMPIIGGLKRGRNLISINMQPLRVRTAGVRGSRTVPQVEVEVLAYSEGDEKVARVFSFTTMRFGLVRKEFEVTDEIIAKPREAVRPLK